MIRKVSTKPIIKMHFRLVERDKPVEHDNESVVFFSFEIGAKGTKLSSELAPAQVQHQGKFRRAVRERAFWSDETLARLLVSFERFKKIHDACAAVGADLAKAAMGLAELDKSDPSHRDTSQRERLLSVFGKVYGDAVATKDSRESEVAVATEQLESVEREMATSDFFSFFSNVLISLKCEDSSDELAYALYKGKVWSCSRELEPKQWILLTERFIEREDMEIAAALASDESSLTRERISTELRRAVWIRDQGKCARCESRERLEYDHIVPLSRGGSNTERNIELLCEVCNRAKSDAIM